MGITYEDAIKAQAELEDRILQDPNVVSIGVIADIDSYGNKTGDYAIKIGVISSEDYQYALTHGESIIPRSYLLDRDNPHQEKCVRIKVVKTGRVKALTKSNILNRTDFPSAIDDIPDVTTQTQALDDYTSRCRPSPCGHSIGHATTTAGTMGLLLEYKEGPNTGKAYILSNNHVIAANNSAHIGDPITQPGRYDSGIAERDTIAKLHRWVPLAIDKINFVDAAVAEVSGGTNWAKYVMPFISQIGYPTDHADAKIGMQVEKTGRTTGYTIGTVLSVNQTVKVTYEKIGVLLFKNQISTTNMSKGGDSGSSLFEAGTKKPVGLLFAGDDSESFHNPIKTALSKLSEEHTYTYSSGKVRSFKSDFPFTIIQKRPYSTRTTVHSNMVIANSLLSLEKQPQKYRSITIATVLGVYTAIASASRLQNMIESTIKPKEPLAVRCGFFGGTAAAKQAVVPANLNTTPTLR